MRLRSLLLCGVLVGLLGCMPRELSSEDFRRTVRESDQNSAGSWWYAGDDKSHSYFVYRLGLTPDWFKVRRGQVGFARFAPQPYSHDAQKWVNIKKGDLFFPGSSSPIE